MSKFLDRLFVGLQHVLPRYWLTALIYRLTRVRTPWFKNLLISRFVALYDVELSEIPRAVPEEYASFNEFFTRDLRDAARPIDSDAASIVSPVDGTLSACGAIEHRRLFQAKGKAYTLDDLLAVDLQEANAYRGGHFATIYLAPYNYHRVHAPAAGRLRGMRYIPGDLYSVNEATVRLLPGLFARNERLVCHFDTPAGPYALIFVGALNVGSISTPWTGELRPRKHGPVDVPALDPDLSTQVSKGQLLGWFNMGSTVIVLYPPDTVRWDESLVSGERLQMGQAIGTRQRGNDAPASD